MGPTSKAASRLVEDQIETSLIPHPVEFAVLLPQGYESSKARFPLLLFLHGGGGDRGFLGQMRPAIEAAWKAGKLPPLVVATPSADRSFYMDYKDGSQKWESFLRGPFLDHLRRNYRVSPKPDKTLLFGISMGGLGILRLAFKTPEKFAGLAALEPGVDPALKWSEVKPRNRFWRSPALMETIFGKPFDEAYWEANNPASLAIANAEKIRASGLAIYIDVGDRDMFNLNEATEFLHRVLTDHHIRHEYHLVLGADHVGGSIGPRSAEAFAFLARVLKPPPPDRRAEALRRMIEPLRKRSEGNR